MWRPFSGWVVVGGGGKGNPRIGGGAGRAFLREVRMGGCLAVSLTKWRSPNGGGCSEIRGHRMGRVWGSWKPLRRGGAQSLRGEVGGAGLKTRLFFCVFCSYCK